MLLENDEAGFKAGFVDRLGAMLGADELGAFILVLANSLQDAASHRALEQSLADRFEALKQAYDPGATSIAPDDRAVFESLVGSGIDGYSPWHKRTVGPWKLAYNPLRGLKPQRASREDFGGLSRDFDPQRFHFDKPFLYPEILSEERFDGLEFRLMYQKFPFVAFHLLILLEPSALRPQFMSEPLNQLAWGLLADRAPAIAGFGIAYNSIGAGASVNHQHLHGFIEGNPLAIEHAIWRHNGGSEIYPVECVTTHSAEQTWEMIQRLHAARQPFNLLYRDGACYILVRPPHGMISTPDWMPDAAWYELSGGFNLVHQADYARLTAQDISAALALF